MLQKLERQRRRLQLQQHVGVGRPKENPRFNVEVPVPTRTLAERTAEQKAISTTDYDKIEEKVAAALDIPPFLKREPVDVGALTAQRKSKEADARKQMPLTGRAALEAIKPKRKKA
jgi:hypothetical protein